jgi:single-strand DNA-binding protein
MYNKVILMGRITHDLELKTTPSGLPVLTFSIAVDRYAGKGEERKADFFRCVAWRANAEFISKWFSKGRCILVEGKLQTSEYVDKNNAVQRTIEIVVDAASFTGEKKADVPPQSGYAAGTYPRQDYNAPQSAPAYGYTPAAPQQYAHPAEASNTNLAASNGTAADFAKPAKDADDGYPF